jgi:hypothetical protein
MSKMSGKGFICLLRGAGLSVAVSLAVGGLTVSAGCGGGGNEAQPVFQGTPNSALLPPRTSGSDEPVYTSEWGHAILIFFREGTTEAERQAVYDKYKLRLKFAYYSPPVSVPSFYGYNAYVAAVPIQLKPWEVAAQVSADPLVVTAIYDDILAA